MLLVSIGKGTMRGISIPPRPLNPGLNNIGNEKITSQINKCISTVGKVFNLLAEISSESRFLSVFISGRFDIQKYKKFNRDIQMFGQAWNSYGQTCFLLFSVNRCFQGGYQISSLIRHIHLVVTQPFVKELFLGFGR